MDRHARVHFGAPHSYAPSPQSFVSSTVTSTLDDLPLLNPPPRLATPPRPLYTPYPGSSSLISTLSSSSNNSLPYLNPPPPSRVSLPTPNRHSRYLPWADSSSDSDSLASTQTIYLNPTTLAPRVVPFGEVKAEHLRPNMSPKNPVEELHTRAPGRSRRRRHSRLSPSVSRPVTAPAYPLPQHQPPGNNIGLQMRDGNVPRMSIGIPTLGHEQYPGGYVPGPAPPMPVSNDLPLLHPYNTRDQYYIPPVTHTPNKSTTYIHPLLGQPDAPVTALPHPVYTNSGELVAAMTMAEPLIEWDVRHPPTTSLTGRHTSIPTDAFVHPACFPVRESITIESKHLPQCYDMFAWQGVCGHSLELGVTVMDVLQTIYDDLQRPVSQEECFGMLQREHQRLIVYQAFEERCRGDALERMWGLKRVDLLGSKTAFLGLTLSNTGNGQRWVMELPSR